MGTRLEVLVTHENITIHNDFVHMVVNLNYTADPCGNILLALDQVLRKPWSGLDHFWTSTHCSKKEIRSWISLILWDMWNQ
jgi:hypothetical protein